MKLSKFIEEGSIAFEKGGVEAEIGELCRKHGTSKLSYSRWRSTFRGISISEANKLRALV